MVKRSVESMEKEADRLVQEWACCQQSWVSGARAECGHHIVSRKNKLLRWETDNIVPLTIEEHTSHHAQPYKYPIDISVDREEWLIQMKNTDMKTYLLMNGYTRESFMLEKLEILKRKIEALKIAKKDVYRYAYNSRIKCANNV